MSKGTSKTMTVIKMLPLLQYVFPEIKNAYYIIDQDTKEEYVRVRSEVKCIKEPVLFNDQIRYTFDVCVSCDSVSALVDDVWRECKRRFG